MIVTFYSYKGGVGRSMAMANVAYLLARQGLRTLIVDFDLEAPGLEQYFQTNHAAARRNPGIVDLLQAYKRSMSVTGPVSGGDVSFKDIDRFIVTLYASLPGGGCLDLLPAGQRESREELDRYASTLRTFDWQDFYFNWEGELFFEWLRGLFVPDRYDVVLVDSRTGVTEMGGICTYQLADAVVMLCAANRQNIRGTRNVIADFVSPPVRATRQFRPLQILVVPARVEQRDQALYDEFMTRFDAEFADVLPEALREHVGYRDLTVPYEPSYAFDERVITDPSASLQQRTIAAAFVRLARAIALLAPAESALRTRGAPDAPGTPVQYDVAKRFAGYDVFLAYDGADADAVEVIARQLRGRGLELFVDRHELASGEDWRARTEQALFHSRQCVIAYGRDGFGAIQTQALLAAVSSVRSAHTLPITVVSLPGADDRRSWSGMPRELVAGAHWIDLRQWTPADAAQTERLVEAWREPAPTDPGAVALPPADTGAAAAEPITPDLAVAAGGVAPVSRPAPAASPSMSTTASYEAPYPGARPFTERDAGFLFSREAETVQVATALEQRPLVVVTGPSGCGKTSLILAAVLPALRQRQAESAGPGWLFERTTPERGTPVADLEQAIARLRAARDAAGKGAQALLFVDELEDLLLQPDPDQRRGYLQRLGDLAAAGSGVTLLIAVREDRLPLFHTDPTGATLTLAKVAGVLPLPLPANVTFVGPHVIALPRLSPDAISDAVERTAQRAGLAFEPGLVRRLVADWGLDQRFLPYLQSVLYDLWARRREGYLTNRAYDDIADPVDAHAESAYARLSPPQQKIAATVIARLLAVTGDMATYDMKCHRLALMTRGMDPYVFEVVLERLIEGHLLYAFVSAEGMPYIAPAFSSEQWARAARWSEQDEKFLEWLVRFARHERDWNPLESQTAGLLTGGPLAEANEWAARRGDDLTAAERGFLDASNADATSRRRARWFFVAALIVVALWAGWTAIQRARQEAQVAAQQSRAAESEQLVSAGDDAAARGVWKEALDSYSRALALVPDSISARLKRGALRDQQRDFKGAVEDFTSAIDVAAKAQSQTQSQTQADSKVPLVQAYLGRGTAWFHQGDARRAVTDLDAALALDPANTLALFNRAVVHEALKDDEAALRDYTAALKANPTFADALFNRGALYERLSRDPGAARDRRAEAAADFKQLLTVKDLPIQTRQAARTRLEGLGYSVGAVERAPASIRLLYVSARDQGVAERVAFRLLAALREQKEQKYEVVSVSAATGAGSGVRYFFLQDENVATAVQQVAQAALADAGYNVPLPTQYVRGTANASQGQIEVWIPSLGLRLLPNKGYYQTATP